MTETTPAAARSQWHAVVIGTDEYPRMPEAKLNGCVRDATSIRDFLVEKLEMPASCLTLLTSPAADPAHLSTGANIRAALAALSADGAVVAGDHVVLFYACHGVRLERANAGGSKQMFYGLAAADLERSGQGFANLVLDREINGFLRRMTKRSVSVTVIADTCHSGASMRAIGDTAVERYLKDVKPPSDSDWVAHHPALAPQSTTGASRGVEVEADRLAEGAAPDVDFVVLAACQDGETAKEVSDQTLAADGTPVTTSHGALTSSLLQALAKVPADQVQSLRWLDFYDDLSRTVVTRIAAQRTTSQKPALEGNPARPVFGGRWKPFAPGFTVREAGGVYNVEGGVVHGLDVGAEVDLYPYDTPDFEASTAPRARAVIDSATLSTSTAKLADPAARVDPKARARLVKPSPSQAPMRVRLADVRPEILSAAQLDGADVAGFVAVAARDTPAHLEVRPYAGEIPAGAWGADNAQEFQGTRDGWVLVRSDVSGAPSLLRADFEAKPEDIIAYLPEGGSKLEGFSTDDRNTRLGQALRDGLVHHARYLRARDRSGGDETLRAMMSVKLRVGDGAAPEGQMSGDDILAQTKILDPVAGVYPVRDGQWLFLEATVLKPTRLRLFAGVVGCSDDGNVLAVWPPEGEDYTFDVGKTTYLGVDRFTPLALGRRQDQGTSLYTLKLIGYTAPPGSAPIDLHSLEQAKTVQDVFADYLKATRGLFTRPPAQPERPAWYTWDFRIACTG